MHLHEKSVFLKLPYKAVRGRPCISILKGRLAVLFINPIETHSGKEKNVLQGRILEYFLSFAKVHEIMARITYAESHLCIYMRMKRNGSVVYCLNRDRGPLVRDSPASLRCVLVQDTFILA